MILALVINPGGGKNALNKAALFLVSRRLDYKVFPHTVCRGPQNPFLEETTSVSLVIHRKY